MVRLRLALTAACLCVASLASAQSPYFGVGMLTPYIGASAGGDVRDSAVTPGVSMAALDSSGFGAEIDLGHAREIDDSRFSSSAITSFTVNAIGMWQVPVARRVLRPFVAAGVGVLRVRAEVSEGGLVTSRTDWAFDAGGGVLYMFNDLIGVRGDVRYFRYFERFDDLPLRDNGFFDYWRTAVGVTFAWPIR
jgi:outer membrane protein with beta-barrel domain